MTVIKVAKAPKPAIKRHISRLGQSAFDFCRVRSFREKRPLVLIVVYCGDADVPTSCAMDSDRLSVSPGTLPRTAPVDIEFQELEYAVRSTETKTGWLPILRGVSGRMHGGELTAILGPSGAGKSTLLNILAGYVCAGVTGSIKINDRPRDMKKFNKMSNYIMQEDLVQQRLSVQESMMITSRLKVGGKHVSALERRAAVRDILVTLGLEGCLDTWSECLSGGQRKRLSVALELVSNPTVLLLDEPTTGLDSVCIKQVIGALKSLALQGRTIICTIHQPSDSEFQLFDQTYFMSEGYCVYNGSTTNLVPYLASVGTPCPKTHSPVDYIIELVHMDTENTEAMSAAILNGKSHRREKKPPRTVVSIQQEYPSFATEERPSFITQFGILLGRMLLQKWRSVAVLRLQLIHHMISAILLGGIFFGIGNDAAMALSNFKFCISILVFFVYTYAMVPVLTFPLEVKLLKREYFNHWYGLKAYYMALTFSSMPAMILNSLVFLVITYTMTNQPMDSFRFVYYIIIGILMGLCSEGFGLFVGSIFSITNGCLVGPATVAPMVALAIYGMGYGPVIEPFMIFLMKFTFIRYGIVGLAKTIYGLDRSLMDCSDEIYCHYKDPSLLLRDLGMFDQAYLTQFMGIIFFTLFYRGLAYLGLRYRLTSEFSNTIMNYARKILRQKG